MGGHGGLRLGEVRILRLLRKDGKLGWRTCQNGVVGCRLRFAEDAAAQRQCAVPTDYMKLFALLNASGTRYVLIGGLAAVMHGVDRTTSDVDVVIDLAPESARALVTALTDAGYRPIAPVDPTQFADQAVRQSWQDQHNMQVFSLWDSENRRPTVDILLHSPVDFDSLWRDAVAMTFHGVTVKVASLEHLIQTKQQADRPQDRADIDRLGAILKSSTSR